SSSGFRQPQEAAVSRDERGELHKTYINLNSASMTVCNILILWRSLRDSNSCTCLERAMSWATRRRERYLRFWAPEPKRAGSIRTNFLDSSGPPLFERIVDAISRPDHPSL